MANFIVTYDLNGPLPSHQDVDRELRALGASRILETVWWLPWYGGAERLRDHLLSTLRVEDGLLVCECSSAAWNALLVSGPALKEAWESAA